MWAAAFSPDGKHLATSSGDQTARVWNLGSGQVLLTLIGHVSGIPAIAFSPDGRWIATASKDRTGRIWNAITGLEQAILLGHEQSDFVAWRHAPGGCDVR